MAEALRLGFVTGTTPDKWARAWRDRRRERLELVPITEDQQDDVVQRGEVDLALVRLPVAVDDVHCVRLYDELPVVVAGRDHFVAAADDGHPRRPGRRAAGAATPVRLATDGTPSWTGHR